MALAAANDVTHATEVGNAFAAVCPTIDPDQLVVQSIVPLMMLSDTTLDRMTSRLGGVSDCNGAVACFYDELSTVAACYP